jgi:hypothetical protein
MIARNDAPNDRLEPDLQSVVASLGVDFSWFKPREQDFASRELGLPGAGPGWGIATKGGRGRGV